jgi:hypothetical protein
VRKGSQVSLVGDLAVEALKEARMATAIESLNVLMQS